MNEQLTPSPVVPHIPSNAHNISAAYSNATALFEAAVLSQLAIILKNQEEVKNQMVKLERNIAHVAAAHKSKATSTAKNMKLQRHLRQVQKNDMSMVSPTEPRTQREDGTDMRIQRFDGINCGFQHVDFSTDPRFQRVTMCGTPAMMLTTKNTQQASFDMRTDSLPSDSNSSSLHGGHSPTDETMVVVPQDHPSPCDMTHNPTPISPQQTLNNSDQSVLADSAPRVFTIEDSLDAENITQPMELQSQSNSVQSSPALSSPVMNVIHPASMVSQGSVPSFPQPFTMHSSNSFISKLNDTSPTQALPVLNGNTFPTQQQHDTEQISNQCPLQPNSCNVAKEDNGALMSATSSGTHMINEGHDLMQQSSIGSQIVPDRSHENTLQDQLQMSTENNDPQHHGGSMAIYPISEDNKPSFDQNDGMYSTTGGSFNHTYEEQYSTLNNGLTVIKDEPKTFDFSQTDLLYLRRNSISIKNFAKKLAEEVYTYVELKLSNCSGTKGKLKLDPERLRRIKTAVFETYDIGANEQKATWTQCKDAINEFCRRKPNKYEYR